MARINIIYDLGQESLFDKPDHTYEIKLLKQKQKEKNIRISNKLFDLMKSEGLLRKCDDGYVFVGKYEEVMELKHKK
ncbi:MAG: hypothetical protein R6V50_03315 [Thermoplasmatota archaeon]